jgi:acetylornithine deacetylase
MTRTLELLERLVRFETVSHKSNLDLIDWAQTLLQNVGFNVVRIPSPNGEKAGLIARLGPDTHGGICLSGHTDVVPTDGQNWTRNSFNLTRDGTRVFGRGTTDMKGFIASALALAERASGANLSTPLRIILSYDEEVGCVGIREMLAALVPHLGQPELIIVGEPTSMQVAIGHKGKAALNVMCRGTAGHSALAPKYLNAIHVAADFVTEMRSLQTILANGFQDNSYDISYTTVHMGKISGGQALNIVPDLVNVEMEYRHLAETASSDVLAKIQTSARRVSDAHGDANLIKIEPFFAYPGLNQDTQAEHVKLAQMLADRAKTIKVSFGTEAGYFADLGHPTVVIGPGDMASDGHKPDEGLDLAELHACDAFMDRVLKRLADHSAGVAALSKP